MSTDNHEQEVADNGTDVAAIEPAVEIPSVEGEQAEEFTENVEAVEETVSEEPVAAVELVVNEPVAVDEPVVEELDIKPDAPLISPSDILLGVFSKRIIDSIDQALWASAVDAVKQGRTVLLKGSSPHVFITQDVFDPDGKLPPGVLSPASVLNNLLAGIV